MISPAGDEIQISKLMFAFSPQCYGISVGISAQRYYIHSFSVPMPSNINRTDFLGHTPARSQDPETDLAPLALAAAGGHRGCVATLLANRALHKSLEMTNKFEEFPSRRRRSKSHLPIQSFHRDEKLMRRW